MKEGGCLWAGGEVSGEAAKIGVFSLGTEGGEKVRAIGMLGGTKWPALKREFRACEIG